MGVTMMDNSQLQLAYDYVQGTGAHVFLTGKAGTGKTTFLHRLRQQCSKRMVVVAPTGVAALNAGGVTIHSFFQLPFGPLLPSAAGGWEQVVSRRVSRNKIKIMQGLDLLVIDEISMVRADVLDGIDAVLRRYKDQHLPFGGVQLLMIGDLQQLPPVIKKAEWDLLKGTYETGFFFGSRALQQVGFVGIELQHIYRQSDPVFIDLLAKVRENRLDEAACHVLNLRYRPNGVATDDQEAIILTTHNAQAQQINQTRLSDLQPKARSFSADISGDFPEYLYPTEVELRLKVGARVMFVKNDTSPEKRYYNGKIGTLVGFEDDALQVQCPQENEPIFVEPATWENTQYRLDEETKEIQTEVAGTFTQVPLKLAWAITIHKSQGLTFDRAIIDARAAFAHGQVYVALSRCRSLDGLVLSTPIRSQGLPSDTEVLSFNQGIAACQPGPQDLVRARHDYQLQLLLELFDFTAFHQALARILKRLREHTASLAANPWDRLVEVDRAVCEHISDIAEKFRDQIKSLAMDPGADLEGYGHLQERVTKGCLYFGEKIKDILQSPLEGLAVETDNKAVRKSLQEALEQLYSQVRIKQACLQACAAGFAVRTYLKVRAEAALESHRPPRRSTTRSETPSYPVTHPELYERLKAWREKKAEQGGVSPNTILSLKTLAELANQTPTTRAALKRTRGIGKKTIQRVGDELLAILSDFQSTSAQAQQKQVKSERPKQPKPSLRTTRDITFDLFNQGKTVAEIATVRGLAESTIEGHLGHLVRSGHLPLERVIALDKAQPAIKFFTTADSVHLSPAKEHFGETYSYGELKMIVQHLLYTGVMKEG